MPILTHWKSVNSPIKFRDANALINEKREKGEKTHSQPNPLMTEFPFPNWVFSVAQLTQTTYIKPFHQKRREKKIQESKGIKKRKESHGRLRLRFTHSLLVRLKKKMKSKDFDRRRRMNERPWRSPSTDFLLYGKFEDRKMREWTKREMAMGI